MISAKTTPATIITHPEKRLSLSFPLQPGGSLVSARHTPSLSAADPDSVVSCDKPTTPASSGSFLTALAAQERRVLELREDLQRAEADLAVLKSQWAMHEATRKRKEIRHVEHLQSLPTPTADIDSSAEVNNAYSRVGKELERRKAMYSETSAQKRTVFSGSRHIRTLSLLSVQATDDHVQSLAPTERHRNDSLCLPRSSTMPLGGTQLGEKTAEEPVGNRQPKRDPPREVIIRAGKQIAVDFREGLWTFIEDLRQATVGDEGINGTESRTTSAPFPKIVHSQTNNINFQAKGVHTPVRRPTKAEVVVELARKTEPGSVSLHTDHGTRREPKTGTSRAKAVSPGSNQYQQPNQDDAVSKDDSWDNWATLNEKFRSGAWTGSVWHVRNNEGALEPAHHDGPQKDTE